MKKLEDYLTYEQPTKYIIVNDNYSNEYDVPVLTAGKSFILGYTNEKENVFPKEKLPVIIFDDFTTDCKYVDFPFKVKSSAMKILRPINNANAKFLYYYMKKIKFDNTLHKRYWISEYSKLPIKELNDTEQNNFIKKMEKLEVLINTRNKQIENCNILIKSQFVEMFGTNKKSKYVFDSLNNLTLKITDGKHGGCNGDNNSGFYFVGATEIYNNKINYQTAKEITKNDFEKDYKRCDLKNNDFVIVNTGATIGKSAVVNSNVTDHTLLQKSVALIRTKDDVLNPLYLKYCYEINPDMYNKGNGCARINLLLSQIKETMIPVPPIELQNKFARIVEEIDKQKFEFEKSLKKLEELQEALMQEYFG